MRAVLLNVMMITSVFWASASPTNRKWISQQVTRTSIDTATCALLTNTEFRLSKICRVAPWTTRLFRGRLQLEYANTLIVNVKPAVSFRHELSRKERRHSSSCAFIPAHEAPASARMVDVSCKHDSLRVALGEAKVFISSVICDKWKVRTGVSSGMQVVQADTIESAVPEKLESFLRAGNPNVGTPGVTLRSPKGDIFEVAKVAGILAAKQTSSLIPLCHNLPLLAVELSLTLVEREPAPTDPATTGERGAPYNSADRRSLTGTSITLTSGPVRQCPYVLIRSLVKTRSATGVEMEALTAVAAAGLTVYDMCKSLDTSITIGDMRLLAKTGGKSNFTAVH